MSVARSLANSDASTPEPRSAVLGRSLRFIAILGLVRLGIRSHSSDGECARNAADHLRMKENHAQ